MQIIFSLIHFTYFNNFHIQIKPLPIRYRSLISSIIAPIIDRESESRKALPVVAIGAMNTNLTRQSGVCKQNR